MSVTIAAQSSQGGWARFDKAAARIGRKGCDNLAIGLQDGLVYADCMSDDARPEWEMVGRRIVAARQAMSPPLSMSDLARRLDTAPANLSRFEKGKRPLSAAWAKRIADALGVTPQFLLFGEASDVNQSVTLTSRALQTGKIPVRSVELRGEAAAGVWLEQDTADLVAEPHVKVPVLPDYADLPQFAYRISGPSMDLRRIFDGTYAICIPVTPASLRDGDIVVVERRRGQLVERSCKEFRRAGGALQLWPRSSDPRFTAPIEYPDNGGHDDPDLTVEVVGRVVGKFEPI